MTGGGAKAALEALGAGEAPAAEGEQLDLLPVAAGEVLGGDDDRPEVVERRRRRGRPPGARNRKTADMIAFLEANYASPLVGLVATASVPTKELAKRLGCKMIEAFKLQQDARAAALPYMYAKLPLAVDVKGGGAIALALGVTLDQVGGGVDEAAAGEPASILGLLRNQSLSDGEDGAV